MTILDNSAVGFDLEYAELFNDSAKCRAILQNNEDKIEEFNKWSENMVRFVKIILEEASKMAQMIPNLEDQINKFVSFQDAFGVHKTVEAFDTISSLLRNTQSSNYNLITKISSKLLIPLQKYFQEDFKELKDSRKKFDKYSEKYDGIIHRYYSLSKFKDVSELDNDLVQLYDSRIAYFEQYSDHVTKINNFKETIDSLFLEKITILIDDLSDFFKNLSENFNSVKMQLDKGRGEFEKLNKRSTENRLKNENERLKFTEKIREKWDYKAPITRKMSSEKVGSLMMKRKKTTLGTPWKRIFAMISKGKFHYEIPGKIRGTLELLENLNVMMCEIRPIDLNDRRFCFEIYTGQQSQIYQAESEDDMMDWINSFHAAKSEMVLKKNSPTESTSSISEAVVESINSSLSSRLKFNYGTNLALKKWNEDLHKQFSNLDENEVALCSFPASLHTDIWTQGRVFVSQYAVYFYSSLFGIGTKIITPLKEIIKIDIVQTSFVTVVNFTLSGDSKDLTLKTFNTVDNSTFRVLDHLQLLHRNTQSPDPIDALALYHEIQAVGQVDWTDEEKVAPDEFDSESVANVTNNSKIIEDLNLEKEVLCGCLNHMEKRSVNAVIPIDCGMAFDLMFGQSCPVQHAIQIRRKNRKYKISDWKVNDEGTEEREEFYMFPLNNPLSRAKETECFVTIKLSKKIPGKCYVIDCRTNTPNIPYADAFYTQTRYCITWAGPEQTRISICLGITWLKNPFVKPIIKSATYKAFEETCVDYMLCLRQEIASKIGSNAASLDSTAMEQVNNSGTQETHFIESNNSDNAKNESSNSQKTLKALLNPSKSIEIIFKHKVQILIFLSAFFIGRFFGSNRHYSNSNEVISSYDLELEVIRDMNISKVSQDSIPRSWTSQKFHSTHSKLNNLHNNFAKIRKNIWFSLKKVNELEKQVYKAEMAAVLGDRLLTCYDQKDNPSCMQIQEQWKTLLKG